MIKQIEFRLEGGPTPDGEITLKDLNGIGSALQELATRLARDTVNAAGPGRSKRFVEEFAELRLGGVNPGSTKLRFSKGPADKLDLDLPDLVEADDRFWEVLAAIGADIRPAWTTDHVSESIGRLAAAMRGAARNVAITADSRPPIRIASNSIHLETWAQVRRETAGLSTAAGRLEKVDLRSHEFRLRDDVNNTVELRRVQNDVTAAHLVGQWVVAQGTATVNAAGRVVGLDDAKVDEVVDPAAEFLGRRVVPIEEVLASAPGLDLDGGLDLTDEEFDAFVRAMHQ